MHPRSAWFSHAELFCAQTQIFDKQKKIIEKR